MEITEIEAVVGRLYLTVVDQQKQLAEKDARLAALTPKPPTIFQVATPREDPA